MMREGDEGSDDDDDDDDDVDDVDDDIINMTMNFHEQINKH